LFFLKKKTFQACFFVKFQDLFANSSATWMPARVFFNFMQLFRQEVFQASSCWSDSGTRHTPFAVNGAEGPVDDKKRVASAGVEPTRGAWKAQDHPSRSFDPRSGSNDRLGRS
jgi:hypothetical protein